MSETAIRRETRGISNMLHARTVLRLIREAYTPRFGQQFTHRVAMGVRTAIVGAWIMILGLAALLMGSTIVLFATGSLSAVHNMAYVGFAVIVLGFVINAVGITIRQRAIREMSTRIIAFDPKVTTDGAARLVKMPQLYDRWTSQHPGFESH